MKSIVKRDQTKFFNESLVDKALIVSCRAAIFPYDRMSTSQRLIRDEMSERNKQESLFHKKNAVAQ